MQAPVPATPQPNPNALIATLEWLYDKASAALTHNGGGGTDSEIDTWIRMACAGAGTAGFVTNLGGAFTLPIAIPANLVSTATIQLALVARIAAARGHDPASPEIRAVALACLVGAKAIEILSDAGVLIGTKLAQSAINQITGATLTRINQAVGFRLLTKAGQAGAVNLAKFVPIAGGIVGGSIDAASTFAVGKAAKALFPHAEPPRQPPAPEAPFTAPHDPAPAPGGAAA